MIPLGVLASAHHVSAAGYAGAVLADGPYCYFPLDDVSTPTDVTGTVTPSVVAGVTLGVPGIGDGVTAAAFDGGGTGRGVVIPSASLPVINTMTAFTLEVIAQATNMSASRAVFTREQMSLVRHTAAGAIDAFTGVNGWANRIGAAGYPEPAKTAIHHWATVWDGTTASLYRDGAVVLSEAVAGTLPTATENMLIGSRNVGDVTFLGTLAGFAFYTKGLSAARILAHAQAAGVA